MQGTKFLEKDKEIIDTIADSVSLFYGMKQEELFQRTRKRDIVIKRQVFMSVAKDLADGLISLFAIGEHCKKEFDIKAFDHATVLHAIKTVNDISDTDKAFKEEYEQVKLFARKMINANKAFQEAKSKLIRQLIDAKNVDQINEILTSEEVQDFFEIKSSTLI